MNSVELTGVFGGFRFNRSDTDFIIGYLSNKTSILGDAPAGRLITGVEYRFSGTWIESEKWGRQFKFDGFVQLQPHSRIGVVNYLEKCAHGIGPAIAGRLWDEYGTDAVKILRTKPLQCVQEIDGLGLRVAERASEDLEKLVANENTMIELNGLLNGRGFGKKVAEAAFDLWNVQAPKVIARDPFKLLTHKIKSCGFGRCDCMYLDQGHDPGSLKRQCLCIWHLLSSNSTGSTWHDAESIYLQLGQQVGSTKIQPIKATTLGTRSGVLSTKTDFTGRLWLAEHVKAAQEERIASKIKKILKGMQDEQTARGDRPLPTQPCVSGQAIAQAIKK